MLWCEKSPGSRRYTAFRFAAEGTPCGPTGNENSKVSNNKKNNNNNNNYNEMVMMAILTHVPVNIDNIHELNFH